MTVYLGKADGNLCLVSAVLAYMVQRGPDKGPFFWFTKDRFLTWEHLVTAIRATLDQAGLDSRKYAGHSFWIGAVTRAAQSCLPACELYNHEPSTGGQN